MSEKLNRRIEQVRQETFATLSEKLSAYGKKVQFCEEVDEETGERLPYIIVGEQPQTWIHAGQHGDEWWVTGPLKQALLQLIKSRQLPDCVIVLRASKKAAKAGTRLTPDGIDTNRSWWGSQDSEIGMFEYDHQSRTTQYTPDIESILMARIFRRMVKQHGKAKRMVSFHGDPGRSDTSFYEHTDLKNLDTLNDLRAVISLLGISLFSGFDDPDLVAEGDTATGWWITDGHVRIPANRPYDGDTVVAAHNNGWLEELSRGYVVEIPEAKTNQFPEGLSFNQRLLLIHTYLRFLVLDFDNDDQHNS